MNLKKCRTPNGQFGASGGAVSWDTSQDFGSSAPVQSLTDTPACRQAAKTLGESRRQYGGNRETARML